MLYILCNIIHNKGNIKWGAIEQFSFLKHCTAIAKRIRTLRENHNLLLHEIRNDIGICENSIEPIFSVALGHVLSGIMAHISSSVKCATLAWNLVIEEIRFRFLMNFPRYCSLTLKVGYKGKIFNSDFEGRRIKKLVGLIVILFIIFIILIMMNLKTSVFGNFLRNMKWNLFCHCPWVKGKI